MRNSSREILLKNNCTKDSSDLQNKKKLKHIFSSNLPNLPPDVLENSPILYCIEILILLTIYYKNINSYIIFDECLWEYICNACKTSQKTRRNRSAVFNSKFYYMFYCYFFYIPYGKVFF